MSKRTHSYSVIQNYYNRQGNAYNQFNKFYSSVLSSLIQRKNYMDAKTYSTYMSKLTSLANGLPRLIWNQRPYTYYTWNRRCGWFGCLVGHTGWTYNMNWSFFDQMNSRTNIIKNIQKSIQHITEQNCSNDYTMLPVKPLSGSRDCGMINTTLDFKNSILPTKTISNNVVANLSPSAPQTKIATNVNSTINNYYNWNFQDTPNPNFPSYAQSSAYSTKQTYSLMEKNVATLYNDCSNNNTLISLSPATGIPHCISDKYTKTEATCKSVIKQAGPDGYNYPKGYTQLNELWDNVSNSIPGNTMTAGNAILDSAQNSCSKWQDMFNRWKEAEDKAAATPCLPERTIQATYDPVMLNMAQQWNQSATLYIESLMKRLEIIQKYIETYPNILQLEESDITFGPSSLGGSMLLKYKIDEMTPGVAPVQYLTLLVPNGQDGEQGEPGVQGLPGVQGDSDNSQGPTGPTGNPKLPIIFDK